MIDLLSLLLEELKTMEQVERTHLIGFSDARAWRA